MSAPGAWSPAVGSVDDLLRPRRTRAVAAVGWAAITLVIVAAVLLTLSIITTETGVIGLLTGSVLAALPVVPVLGAFLWLDRYEAEPPRLLLFAFGWGAGVATFGALIINTASTVAIQQAGQDSSLSAVVVAPLVEESLKGLAILAILLLRRREFDGVVDGIVYAGLAAAGFAFVENVLYLGRTLAEQGGGGLVWVFVLRCVVAPFAHPLFTSATGIGLGLAVRTRHLILRLVYPVVGWAVAVLLHGLYNGGASLGLNGFVGEYVLIQAPVFVLFVTLAVGARRREGRLIGRHLAVYATSGWLTHSEVAMLGSLPQRRTARAWAKENGGSGGAKAMGVFQELGTELAFLRERMVRGSAGSDAGERELAILTALGQCRAFFVAR